MVGLAVSLSTGTAASADVTLTVSVETPDGDPVRNATVVANWDDGEDDAVTASNGQALLDVPEGADVTLEVSHADYVQNTPTTVEDAAGGSLQATVHSKAEATISVTNGDGPVADATVTLSQGELMVTESTTDDNGEIETGEIEARNYTLAVRKPGFYSVEQTVEIPADDDVKREVLLERGSITLRVKAVDPYFDPPRGLEGVTVSVSGSGSVSTQSDGTQQLSVPVNTKLSVAFDTPAYDAVEQSIRTAETDRNLEVK